MGTTLLFEENHMVGFLPLKSYLEMRKQLGAGKKCPPEEEDLVRCILFRDTLERLRCTRADLDGSDQGALRQGAEAQEESKMSATNAAGGGQNVGDLFAQIDLQD